MDNLQVVRICNVGDGAEIARFGLNGHRSLGSDPLGNKGIKNRLVWSFKFLNGNTSKINQMWVQRKPMLLVTEKGNSIQVRVAALPADADSHGLIEFMPGK